LIHGNSRAGIRRAVRQGNGWQPVSHANARQRDAARTCKAQIIFLCWRQL